ncbi:MAG TPA: response regulator, partial [Ktedonobacterales bacterium]
KQYVYGCAAAPLACVAAHQRKEAHIATRIMVINDDQDILDLYELLLEDEGYEVVSSKLAFEHPIAVASLHPQLVILDLKFGTELEGWKMMQKLRMYRPTAKLPIIVSTAAVNQAREQEDHLRAEGIGIIYKPFQIEQFTQAVQQVLAAVESDRVPLASVGGAH